MFGIFHALFSAGTGVIGKISGAGENAKERALAEQRGQEQYLANGKWYLTANGRRVITGFNAHGDRVLKDYYTDKVYKNYSKEERDAEYAKLDEIGATVVFVKPAYPEWTYKLPYDKYLFYTPSLYRDRKDSGKFYIEIPVSGVRFYMDIKTELLVRITDTEKRKKTTCGFWNVPTDEIIKRYNENQLKLRKDPRYDNDRKWMEKVYFSNEVYVLDDGKIFRGNYHDYKNSEIKEKIRKMYKECTEKEHENLRNNSIYEED